MWRVTSTSESCGESWIMFQNNVTVFAKLMYPQIAPILSNTAVARSAVDKESVEWWWSILVFLSPKGHFVLQKVISLFGYTDNSMHFMFIDVKWIGFFKFWFAGQILALTVNASLLCSFTSLALPLYIKICLTVFSFISNKYFIFPIRPLILLLLHSVAFVLRS